MEEFGAWPRPEAADNFDAAGALRNEGLAGGLGSNEQWRPSAIAVPGTILTSGVVGSALEITSMAGARHDISFAGGREYLRGTGRLLPSPLTGNVLAQRHNLTMAAAEAHIRNLGLQNTSQALQTAQSGMSDLASPYRIAADNLHAAPLEAGPAADLFRRKQLFFNGSQIAHVGYGDVRAVNFIGTAEQIAASGSSKLFLEGSQEARALQALEQTRREMLYVSGMVKESKITLQQAGSRLAAAEAKILNSTAAEQLSRGMARGMGYSALGLVGGAWADKVIADNRGLETPQIMNPVSLLSDGVATPALLISDLPARYKIPAALALFVGTRAVNAYRSAQR